MVQERSNFNPCAHQGLIYIPGGLASTNIEVFDPEHRSFLLPLDVQLPERQATVSWVEDGRLTIVSRRYVTTVVLKTGRADTESHADTEFYSKSHPVIARGYVYFADHDNRIFRVGAKEEGTRFQKLG